MSARVIHTGHRNARREMVWALFAVLFGVACSTSYGAEDAPTPGPDASTSDDATAPSGSDGGLPDGRPPETPADAAAPLVKSCATLHAQQPDLVDGTYTIDPAVQGVGPISVYCFGMTQVSGPVEYLNLVHSFDSGEPSSNFTKYPTGGACNCGDLVRYFTKVRLRVADMTILVDDLRFSTLSRATTCDATALHCHGPSMSYGQAGSCIAEGDASGTANIDLRGTGFAVAMLATFSGAGNVPGGSATVSGGRDFVLVTGGGFCGWWRPSTVGLLPIVRAT